MKKPRTVRTPFRGRWHVLLIAAALLIGGAVRAPAADDQPQIAPDVAALERRVQSGTEALLAAAGAARAAEAPGRSTRGQALLQAAERREAAMLSLMESAPAAALRNALPARWRSRLPPEVRAHVEQAVTTRGTLEVFCVLEEDGRHRTERYLDLGRARLQAFLEGEPEDYPTGTVLTVQGVRLSGRLAAAEAGVLVDRMALRDEQAVNGDGIAARRVLVINVNFSDRPAAQPWTIPFVRNLFAGQVAPWFEEGSYRQVTTAADVIGWFTIPVPSTRASPGTIQRQAAAAARAAGYNPGAYQHVVIAFPRVAAFGWAGLGQVPGRIVWINNSMALGTLVHELGHNLGLSHSQSRRYEAGPLWGAYARSEYGDRFDAMGSGNRAHYHAAYRAGLGWIPPSDVATVTPADGKAVVALRSAASPSGTRVLRVRRGGTNTDQYLYVETREALGFDSVLGQYPALRTGVAVYLGTGLRSQSLIDLSFTTATVADAPLLPGATLYDFAGDVTITPLYNVGGETYVLVRYGSDK